MTERLNIISMCCNVSLDGIDQTSKTASEQIVFKNHINHLFNIAFKYIGQTNRIILITGTGAEMAYSGAPEDALLVATDIVNGILFSNKPGSTPLSVRIGIHLQPVLGANDFNEQSNIIGASINAAKQILSKAKPNKIVVSRAYYENIPVSAQAISTLFDDLDVKNENHVLDYHAYLVDLNQKQVSESQPVTLDQPVISTPSLPSSKKSTFSNTSNWTYVLVCLIVPIVLFSIVKLAKVPADTLPLKASQTSNLKTQSIKADNQLKKSNGNDNDNILIQQKLDAADPLIATIDKENIDNKTMDSKTVDNKTTGIKEVKQKPKSRLDSTAKKSKAKELISWETLKNSLKQGQKHACTQSEIAMNQCRE